MILLLLALVIADPITFWTNRGGRPIAHWCQVGVEAQIQQALYGWPTDPTGPKISIFAVEHYEQGVLQWRARFSGELKIVLWGPIPIAEERAFAQVVSYYRSACGL